MNIFESNNLSKCLCNHGNWNSGQILCKKNFAHTILQHYIFLLLWQTFKIANDKKNLGIFTNIFKCFIFIEATFHSKIKVPKKKFTLTILQQHWPTIIQIQKLYIRSIHKNKLTITHSFNKQCFILSWPSIKYAFHIPLFFF